MSQFKEFTERVSKSITLKLIMIGFLILIMLIPTEMIKSLIRERQDTSRDAINEVSMSWGKEQTICGPYITLPYKAIRNVDGQNREITLYYHILPEDLKVEGKIVPEIRKRGIYHVVVYESEINLSGNFVAADFSNTDIDSSAIMWDKATINLGITDMRGIQDAITVEGNGNSYNLNPGLATRDLAGNGVSSYINLDQGQNFNFHLKLNLNGSKNFSVIPLGGITEMKLSSPWSHPSFNGQFLPREHNITSDGFDAYWKVLHLNRSYPQQWTGDQFDVSGSGFGLDLIIPVDHYQKAFRSVRYAIMFIALTFITFFFIEIINKKLLHFIHYLLVGFALVIFYSLLLSLSEHMSFNLAYLVSSVAVISLITVFGAGLFKNRKQTITLAAVLLILYAFLFTILQLMDYALLMGNIGLFLVLAVVMYFTRKIKWNDDSESLIDEH